jgi:ABC-2 type transport system permease protein
MRRALLGSNLSVFPTLLSYSNAELFGVLAILTSSFGVVAWLAFRFFDRMARDRGMIDAQSNF